MDRKPSKIKRTILARTRFLQILFWGIGICIMLRIVWIQVGPDGERLRKQAERVNFSVVMQDASRGDILGRGGEILATSLPRYYVGIDYKAGSFTPEVLEQGIDGLSEAMSRFFGDKSKAEYKSMIRRGYAGREKRRYQRITPRAINYNELQTVKQFPILCLPRNKGGRIIEQDIERVRPFGGLAERTIGKTAEYIDTVRKPGIEPAKSSVTEKRSVKGYTGIENSMDDCLRGTHGWTLKQKISSTLWVPVKSHLNVEPINGKDVVTTIDPDIQDVAEEALRRRLIEASASWGTVVVMEVATGEIHAIANLTRYGQECREDVNYAIGSRLEPGSTFKLASLLALIDDAGMDIDEKVDTEGGRIRLDGKTYVDDHKVDSLLTLKQVFELSSNVGFIKCVREHYGSRPQKFIDYLATLGMREKLGTRIAGEAVPKMWTPKDKGRGQWSKLTLNAMAYGYGFEISPLHTLALYNAVANDGQMVRPKLIREISQYGQTLEKFPTEYINRKICSESSLNKVRRCLEGVVDVGTGSALKNPYYTVAAKTGTAQVANGRGGYTDEYGGRNYLATMVGYFPADNPKYSCIVAIKTYYGRGNYVNYYGAGLAGPVFKAVADRIYSSHTEWQRPVRESFDERSSAPVEIKGGDGEQIKRVAGKLGIELRREGRLKGWTSTRADSAVVHTAEMTPDEGTVPSVRGMGLKDAVFMLESAGLRVSFNGKGKVVSQSLAAGTKINKGQNIVLTLR